MATYRKLTSLAAREVFQWFPARTIDAYKVRRLGEILTLCAKIPLYAEKFRAAGVSPRDFRVASDLVHFPTLTRDEVIAAYPDGILSREPRSDDVLFRTSGTSGQFMRIAYGAREADFLDAVYARALFNVGYRPWDRIAYYWWEAEPKPLRAYERLGLMKKDFLQVHADPNQQIEDLERLRPDVVYHFPSSMLLIARILERKPSRAIHPRLVICHGELMTSEQRAYLERVLACPVYDQYGAQEFNRMGWDCSHHQGLHEDSDSVHIEILAGDRPAEGTEQGDLVVTGLANELMPLVRYRIGDTGSFVSHSRCACGRALRRFRLTEGRADDVLELEGGRRIGPRTLAPRIEDLRGFRQYRVVQRSPTNLEVLVVCDAEADGELERRLTGVVQGVVGSAVTIDVKRVPEIRLSKRGKLRKIVGLRAAGAY